MEHQNHSYMQNDFTFYRQKPDGDIDPAGEAGWYLQREREKRGVSLEQAGETCGIHPHHLDGIETGDLTKLPPRTEALRMVGTYAQFLELDPQPLILHYAQFLPQPVPLSKRRRPRRPHPLTSAKIIKFVNIDKLKSIASSSGAGGIVASVLAGIVLFQGMVFMLSPGTPTNDTSRSGTEVIAQSGELAPIDFTNQTSDGEIVASISKITESTLEDAVNQRIGQLARDADQAAGRLSGLSELIEQDAANIKIPIPKSKPVSQQTISSNQPVTLPVLAPAQTGKGKTYGSENKNSRLVLKAKAAVWIRIEDRQGNVVMTQTLQKGDTYRVPDRSGLIVIARDGGLISFSVDGVDKGPIGDRGEILVGRSLDLAALSNQQG